ncbi:MAG: hypothetical protein ACI81L_000375 [Verrucomicrobiales bacterium]|jgi:hypothetical protein
MPLALSAVARSDSDKNSSSDSSKKVAKAAKAGATPSASVGREQRSLGFPMAMVGVFIAGIALVSFAWQARDVEALSPSFDDHWHLAYGIYDCREEGFLANLEDPQVANSGIHTHGDGVIHLHPFSSTATGNNAQIERFLEATRAQFDGDTALTFTNRAALTEDGAVCGGEPAVLQIARFAPGETTASEVITEDLANFRFRADQEGVVIALAPLGAEIPPPPSAAVDTARQASPNIVNTDGLGDSPATGGIGFDDDGNLVGPDGELILDADGEPINQATIQAEADAAQNGDSSDG